MPNVIRIQVTKRAIHIYLGDSTEPHNVVFPYRNPTRYDAVSEAAGIIKEAMLMLLDQQR